MDLLNEQTLNSSEFHFLCNFFNNSENNSKITYQQFKINILNFAKEVMKNYLKDTPYEKETCSCFCHNKLDSNGTFTPKFNIIFIHEDIIEKMYKKRDFTALSVLFHELNHFKFKYDVKLGFFDESLVRIIKEDLISESPLQPAFLKRDISEKNTYYKDNYDLYSEEKLADLYAIENLLLFMKKTNMTITETQKLQINVLIKNITRQYRNYLRDVHNNINFNSYVIDFEEAFDILIKDHPSWLQYPQLQIEYYLDEFGNVVKRNDEELKELLKKETDASKKEYIEKLLNKSTKKDNQGKTQVSILNKKVLFQDIKKSNKI